MTWCHCVGTVQSGTGERNWEKVALEALPEDAHRCCRTDVLWQTIPYTSNGNRKDSVANGRQSCGRWSAMKMRRTQSLMSLDVCHLTNFVDKVRWCRTVKTCIQKDGTLESLLLWSLQTMKMAEQWSDVVRKDEPSSSVHHWLEPWYEVRWDAGHAVLNNVVQSRADMTSRSLDRLSVWIVWTHYAVDDYVKIWSNSDKKCRRRSILKVLTSWLWCHRVTWWRHHSTALCTLFYRLPIATDPLSPFVSEIFDLKCLDRQTDIHVYWQ